MDDPTLPYAAAKRPGDYWTRPRLFALAAVVVGIPILLVVLLNAWPTIRIAYYRHRFNVAQTACLDYTLPPSQVVYEEDPARFAALTTGPLRFHPTQWRLFDAGTSPALVHCPPPIEERLSAEKKTRNGTFLIYERALFLHQRTTPAGQECLVQVTYLEYGPNIVEFLVTPAQNQGTEPAASVLNIRRLTPTPYLRFFAGQPDPKDPAHFTMAYEYGAAPGTIDAHLNNDLTVTILPSGGALHPELAPEPAYIAWTP